ncbi:hypothetical protein [Actinoplanes couchii]|uniref:Secreted protein n=1 Tax=Actinoplanes couchii TaxID=403638 RepID=A0ABQ3XN41_9ACTN|nr:hypothetical protein [Actinoplanes couchii]MDR6318150.1 hypothetical protein [Actinoplanes couchii]GID59934.1 hypothetical protein Aco03nite_083380 [Actinoplanes couchii]
MQWYLLIIGIVLAVVATAVVLQRRRRRPLTTQEKAQAAMAAIRRKSPRPNRDALDRGHGVPDRHSGGIIENAIYGDTSTFDSGSGGGGGSSH